MSILFLLPDRLSIKKQVIIKLLDQDLHFIILVSNGHIQILKITFSKEKAGKHFQLYIQPSTKH